MKKDVPFAVTFLLAFLLHLLAGVGLKYSRLLAASPPPPAARPPLTMHFVEVPPNATSIPQAVNTTNASDANRKAGPLEKASPKRPVVAQPMMQPPGPPGSPRVVRRAAPASTPAESMAPQAPDDATASITVPGQKLSKSLENLDYYIRGGAGGAGGAGGEGDVPTGDPGSGVFFDTQGYDLGPWGNRAVQIVRSNWIIPVAAELGMKGVVGISFKVARDGTIRELEIVSPSGVPSFDQAALRALQSSSPLPALPADYPRDVLPGVFRFYYNLSVPQS